MTPSVSPKPTGSQPRALSSTLAKPMPRLVLRLFWSTKEHWSFCAATPILAHALEWSTPVPAAEIPLQHRLLCPWRRAESDRACPSPTQTQLLERPEVKTSCSPNHENRHLQPRHADALPRHDEAAPQGSGHAQAHEQPAHALGHRDAGANAG